VCVPSQLRTPLDLANEWPGGWMRFTSCCRCRSPLAPLLCLITTSALFGNNAFTPGDVSAWFWLNCSSLPNVSKNRRYVGIGCSQRHRVRLICYFSLLPLLILISRVLILISRVFVFRILRRAMCGAHDHVRVEISCFALGIKFESHFADPTTLQRFTQSCA